MYGKDDIIEAMYNLGHIVEVETAPLTLESRPEELRERLMARLKCGYDAVFTSNYYSLVSECCKVYNIEYYSWTYDSPRIALYDASIMNSINNIFVFDSFEVERLRMAGVNAHYMPLAVNPKRLEVISINSEDRVRFLADVSMVASLYNEDHNLFDRLEKKINEYSQGYLWGAMLAQENLFGAFILEEILQQNEWVLDDIRSAMSYKTSEGSLTSDIYVYANYFLARKVAELQRLKFIDKISKIYQMKIYTSGDVSNIGTAISMGAVDYLTDMNKVFQLSKVNLNITLPSIHTGIPLRAMDIMGAGGFLLTNYQADFERHFEAGTDYVYYTSLEDAICLIDYYLSHDEERNKIAMNGCRKVREQYSYENMLSKMLVL